MFILADQAAYDLGKATFNSGAFVIVPTLFFLALLIPAAFLKLMARWLEKVEVSLGTAYATQFLIFAVGIGLSIGFTFLGHSFGYGFMQFLAYVRIPLLFFLYSWLIANNFETSLLGGLKIFVCTGLASSIPFGIAIVMIVMVTQFLLPQLKSNRSTLGLGMNFPSSGPIEQPPIPPAMPPRLNIPIQPPPAQSSPPRSLNLNLPDKAENSPLPTSPQSKESAATPPRALFKTPTSHRRKDNYPITIPIPTGFTRLTSTVPVKPGFRLKACWGRQWHDVTVKEVNKDDSLFIHWEKFGDGFDGDLPRNQLIISQSILKGIKAFSEDEPKTENSNTAESTETSEKPEAAEQTESSSNESSTPSADKEEKQSDKFKVVITSVGKQSVQVAKAFGKLNELSLADSLEFIENVPLTLKRNLSREAADKLAREFKALGATVTVEQQ